MTEKINHEDVVRRLRAIARQIACMPDDEFSSCLKDGHFDAKFDNYCWGEPSKVQTSIKMAKICVACVCEDV